MSRVPVLSGLVCSILLATAAASAAPSLVIKKDGTRRLGTLEVDGSILVCKTSYGDVRMTLGQVAEIVGPHSDLIEVPPSLRREHRLPRIYDLVNDAIGRRLEGDPDLLEEMITEVSSALTSRPLRRATRLRSRSSAKPQLAFHLRGFLNVPKSMSQTGRSA